MNSRLYKVKNHFAYSFWIYVLIVILSIVFWDLLYTATKYKPPEDKIVELYIADNPLFDEKGFETQKKYITEQLLSDMEEVSIFKLIGQGTDDYMSNMQINTFILAGQGDVYIMSKERFQSYASSGAFLALDEYIHKNAIIKNNYDYKRGLISYTDSDNVKHSAIYGISLRNSIALKKYGIDIENSYIAILYNNANNTNSVKLLNYLINIE